MNPGDTVKVRRTGRLARIISAISDNRYQVEYLASPDEDPIDRDTVQSGDEGGIYTGDELELVD
jgi:hypothetical protein